jgi:ubiquitin carboxyl-terminal hydrolase 8
MNNTTDYMENNIENKTIELGVSRFKNVDGVSCYMVSVLHILQQLPIFIDFISNYKYKKYIKNTENCIMHEIARAINLSLTNDNIRIAPDTLKRLVGKKNTIWGMQEHQDSQEFYTFIINSIEEECGNKISYIPVNNNLINNPVNNLVNNSVNNVLLQIIATNYIQKSEIKDFSPIKNMFIGYLISNVQCIHCNTLSPSFESFITLSLSIPINKNTNEIFKLEDCLNNFVTREQLDIQNKLNCDICGIKNQSLKMIQFWKSPTILVIQLKRFIVNDYGIQTEKITNPVIYPLENFDIKDYFHPDSPHKINTKYNLIGINCHYEFGSINSGHYISIVKSNYNKKWYLFDDSNEVQELNTNIIQDKNAYLLFYHKI